jgi:hypothetical protein
VPAPNATRNIKLMSNAAAWTLSPTLDKQENKQEQICWSRWTYCLERTPTSERYQAAEQSGNWT